MSKLGPMSLRDNLVDNLVECQITIRADYKYETLTGKAGAHFNSSRLLHVSEFDLREVPGNYKKLIYTVSHKLRTEIITLCY